MKDLLKYSIWTGIYAVLIVPFIVADSMFFPYIVGKAFTFRIIVEIIFGLWLILAIAEKEFRPKFSWLLWSLGLFTLVLFIADLNAVAPVKAFWSNFERMEGWVTIIHLLAYFLVLTSMFKTKAIWLWFLRANVFAGLVLAITSIDSSSGARFSGPLGNPIYISIYFLFIFFFTLLLWYKDVLIKKNIFANVLFYIYPLVSILSFYAVYRTSRGVLIGAVMGLFLSAVLIAIFEKEKKLVRGMAVGLIVLLVASLGAFFALKDTSMIRNNPTLSRLAEVSWSNVSGQARQYIWPMAIEGFKEKPILGWGQDGFNYVFNKYYDPRMYAQEPWFDRSHNAPLDALVAGGALGLLAYLSTFLSALYLLWFRKNSFDIPTRSIFTGLLAGYFFQGLFVFDTLMSYIFFITTLAYIHSRLVEEKSHHPVFHKEISSDQQNYILIPLIVILTGVSIYWVNVPAIKANRTLIQALSLMQSGRIADSVPVFEKALSYGSFGDSEIREQLITRASQVAKSNKVDGKAKTDFIDLAFNEINKQIALVPSDARNHLFAGGFLLQLSQYEQALPYLEKAIELSPRKQTMHFQRVMALMNLGRTEEAIAEAKATYELDINYPQAKLLYDEVLKVSKNR